MQDLSIVIPVYNERLSIEETVVFFQGLADEHPGLEVIVVDDGSTDETPEFLASLDDSRIRVITHEKNRGYGAALKSGIKSARGDVIAITDADSSYPNDRIPDLYGTLAAENADMVVGARTGKHVSMGVFRRLGKFFLRNLAEYLSKSRIPDFNSGLRVMKKDLIFKALRYLPDGFSFTTTLSLYMLSNQYKIAYVSIDYHRRKGKSKIKPLSDTLNFFQLIVRTVMFFDPLKVFLPLSGFFVFLAFAVLIISYLAGKVMDVTTILLFITGLQLLALGLLADLIDKRLEK